MATTTKKPAGTPRGVPLTTRAKPRGKKGEGETITLTARVSREKWLAFRKAVAADGVSMNEKLNEFIDAYVVAKGVKKGT